jgi:hypothetical protein
MDPRNVINIYVFHNVIICVKGADQQVTSRVVFTRIISLKQTPKTIRNNHTGSDILQRVSSALSCDESC